jgi:hypothetical protein
MPRIRVSAVIGVRVDHAAACLSVIAQLAPLREHSTARPTSLLLASGTSELQTIG